MSEKTRPEYGWWVETSVRKPKRNESQKAKSALPVGMKFYAAAADYDQELAKEHLTDNNLRLARSANPPLGGWAYVRLTEEESPQELIDRLRRQFPLPAQARGVIVDHGRVVRLLICGPQFEDWMIDIRLAEENSVDVYVWGVLYREKVFRRRSSALKQAQAWARNLIDFPPSRHELFRGSTL